VLFYVKLGELIRMNPVEERKNKIKFLMQISKNIMQSYKKEKEKSS
jgi:hypothetical protein